MNCSVEARRRVRLLVRSSSALPHRRKLRNPFGQTKNTEPALMLVVAGGLTTTSPDNVTTATTVTPNLSRTCASASVSP